MKFTKLSTSLNLCLLVGILFSGVSLVAFNQRSSGQIGGMSNIQNIGPTYAVSIVPGAAQKTSPYHYYPDAIAVPVGTVVAWFNNDFGQPHTVTSGLKGSSDSGSFFHSGIMPATANSFFQYAFDKRGDYLYHCEIHPWRVAKVSASDYFERDKNFEFRSGTGPTFNLTKDSRDLLDFKPITIPLDRTTPISYNITIIKNNADKVFSGAFVTNGNSLPLELITALGGNQTRVYGPDFSSTGAYHLIGQFLTGNASYKFLVNITAINSKPPSGPISGEFNLNTIESS